LLGIFNLLQSGMKCCFVLTFFDTFLGQAKKVYLNYKKMVKSVFGDSDIPQLYHLIPFLPVEVIKKIGR